MTANAVLLAFVRPADTSDEQELNRWYDEIHIPQLIERVPGVLGARRYRIDADQGAETPAPANPYLAIYEIDPDDVSGTVDRINAALADGTLEMTTAIDLESAPPVMHVFRPV
ncbi:hypothetical protein AAFP35_00035 [Gordonia sp. CPCC 206044]|uniref:hypothetical protein n=1 Tax=Gordonia sp. CPCC 206044 TaxID=3140793 RepID=UPI003AF39764